MTSEIRILGIEGIPEVHPGDDLASLILAALEGPSRPSRDDPVGTGGPGINGEALRNGDILVVAQKVVSKAEGRTLALADVEPSEEAQRIALQDAKDPRHIEIMLRESVRTVRHGHRVLICETRHGFVCANAGVDLSNAPGEADGGEVAILLPEDPDASAERIRAALGPGRGVVISDTFGRPWREGLLDLAIGVAGMAPLRDQRGDLDREGRELQVTVMALADQLTAAAGMLMEKSSGIPAVWVEGVTPDGEGSLADLLRDPENDLFR